MTSWENHHSLKQAASVIRTGGVVAYPTEAVWGLGCDPYNRAAVERILALKQRRMGMGLILVAANIEQLAPYLTQLSSADLQTLNESWPGPVTWLIPNNGAAPAWITGDYPTLAVRVSAHPLVKSLCSLVGKPLVSTSANPHGKPAARDALKLRCYFGQGIDFVSPGKVGKAVKPSEIRELGSGTVRRPA